MRRIALLPFGGADAAGPAPETAAAPPEPDAAAPPPPPEPFAPGELSDLRAWVRRALAAELAGAGVLAPLLLELDRDDEAPQAPPHELAAAAELGDVAGSAGAELACAAALDAGWGMVRVRLRLAGAEGEERLQLQQLAGYRELASLPAVLARAVLLAVGEDAAVAAPDEQPEVPAEALLAFCRAARQLEEARREVALAAAAPVAPPAAEAAAPPAADAPAAEPPPAPEPPRLRAAEPGDPALALDGLLEACEVAPQLTQARALLLEEAAAAAGGPWMPAFLAALERLVELSPGDVPAMLALGDYRRLHLDDAGARALYLEARAQAEAAGDGAEELRALDRLAALAEAAGRHEEAAQHLRAAVRLADDAALYRRLGLALRTLSPLDSMRALQRAVALSPDEPRLRLELSQALLLAGDPQRGAAEATKVSRQHQRDPAAAREAGALLRQLLGGEE